MAHKANSGLDEKPQDNQIYNREHTEGGQQHLRCSRDISFPMAGIKEHSIDDRS